MALLRYSCRFLGTQSYMCKGPKCFIQGTFIPHKISKDKIVIKIFILQWYNFSSDALRKELDTMILIVYFYSSRCVSADKTVANSDSR